MSYEVEKDWTTTSGLRAAVIMTDLGHRCGYVGVPASHPFFGIAYNEQTALIKLDPERSTEKMGAVQIFLAAGKNLEDLNSPEYVFEVHGGLTYSGNGGEKRKGTYPVESDLWWFGYDCGHAGDLPAPGSRMSTYYDQHEGEHRTLDYCINECESLATQLANVKEQTNV